MTSLNKAGPLTTRFAPSPSGPLHLGHAFAAIFAHDMALRARGRFLVRIEDIDAARCRPEYEAAILEDLAWLGLHWQTPVRRQSEHLQDHASALARLDAIGVLYPCFCTRRDIAEEIARSPAAPHGPEGALYPGICRDLDPATRRARIDAGEPHALRIDVAAAVAMTAGDLTFIEQGAGPDGERGTVTARPSLLGDVVLARKDLGTSYHLAVTVDDAIEGVTLVTRGRDLFHATHIHRLLQALLDLPVPDYHHHGLIADETGRRLATRDKAHSLKVLREAGATPDDVRRMVGLAGAQAD